MNVSYFDYYQKNMEKVSDVLTFLNSYVPNVIGKKIKVQIGDQIATDLVGNIYLTLDVIVEFLQKSTNTKHAGVMLASHIIHELGHWWWTSKEDWDKGVEHYTVMQEKQLMQTLINSLEDGRIEAFTMNEYYGTIYPLMYSNNIIYNSRKTDGMNPLEILLENILSLSVNYKLQVFDISEQIKPLHNEVIHLMQDKNIWTLANTDKIVDVSHTILDKILNFIEKNPDSQQQQNGQQSQSQGGQSGQQNQSGQGGQSGQQNQSGKGDQNGQKNQSGKGDQNGQQNQSGKGDQNGQQNQSGKGDQNGQQNQSGKGDQNGQQNQGQAGQNGQQSQSGQAGQNGQQSQSGQAGQNGQQSQSGQAGQNGQQSQSGQAGQNGQQNQSGQAGQNGQQNQSGQAGQNGQQNQSGQVGQGDSLKDMLNGFDINKIKESMKHYHESAPGRDTGYQSNTSVDDHINFAPVYNQIDINLDAIQVEELDFLSKKHDHEKEENAVYTGQKPATTNSKTDSKNSSVLAIPDLTKLSSEISAHSGINIRMIEPIINALHETTYETLKSSLSTDIEELVYLLTSIFKKKIDNQSDAIFSGIIDNRKLMNLAFDNYDIFKIIDASSENFKDSIFIGVDLSGSMLPRIKYVIKALILIHEVLKIMKIKHAIFGFNTSGSDACHYPIIKFDNFDEDQSSYAIAGLNASGANRDGLSIRVFNEYIKSVNMRPLYLTITDGNPHHINYSGEAAIQDTKEAIEDMGLSTIAVCIGDKENMNISKVYDNAIECQEVYDLPELLNDLLMDIFV